MWKLVSFLKRKGALSSKVALPVTPGDIVGTVQVSAPGAGQVDEKHLEELFQHFSLLKRM